MSKQQVLERWPDASIEPEYNRPGPPSFYSVWDRTHIAAKRAGCTRGLLAYGKTESEAWERAARAIRAEA